MEEKFDVGVKLYEFITLQYFNTVIEFHMHSRRGVVRSEIALEDDRGA